MCDALCHSSDSDSDSDASLTPCTKKLKKSSLNGSLKLKVPDRQLNLSTLSNTKKSSSPSVVSSSVRTIKEGEKTASAASEGSENFSDQLESEENSNDETDYSTEISDDEDNDEDPQSSKKLQRENKSSQGQKIQQISKEEKNQFHINAMLREHMLRKKHASTYFSQSYVRSRLRFMNYILLPLY